MADEKKLVNKNFKTDWLYSDITWRCIPDTNCDDIEVDRDGKYTEISINPIPGRVWNIRYQAGRGGHYGPD